MNRKLLLPSFLCFAFALFANITTKAHLPLLPPMCEVFNTFSASACDSMVSPSGTYTWYSSGTYQDTMFAAAQGGCDSVITVNLTINNSYPLQPGTVILDDFEAYANPAALGQTWVDEGAHGFLEFNTTEPITGSQSLLYNLDQNNPSRLDTLYFNFSSPQDWTNINQFFYRNKLTSPSNPGQAGVFMRVTVDLLDGSGVPVHNVHSNVVIFPDSAVVPQSASLPPIPEVGAIRWILRRRGQNILYNYNLDSVGVNGLFPTGYDTITVCPGDSLLYGSTYYAQSGNYLVNIPSSAGCDSTIQLSVNIAPPTAYDTVTVCPGDSALYGGFYFSSAGDHLVPFSGTSGGCDSTILLTLLNEIPTYYDTVAACIGDSILYGGTYYSQSGNYRDTIITAVGCDSVIVLTVNIEGDQSALAGTFFDGFENHTSRSLKNNWRNTNASTQVSLSNDAYDGDHAINVVSPANTFFTIVRQIAAPIDATAHNVISFWAKSNNPQPGASMYVKLHSAGFTGPPFTPEVVVDLSISGYTYYEIPLTYTVSFDPNAFYGVIIGEDGLNSDAIDVSFDNFKIGQKPLPLERRSICFGDSLLLAGQMVSEEGIYIDSLQSALSCGDSVVAYEVAFSNAFLPGQSIYNESFENYPNKAAMELVWQGNSVNQSSMECNLSTTHSFTGNTSLHVFAYQAFADEVNITNYFETARDWSNYHTLSFYAQADTTITHPHAGHYLDSLAVSVTDVTSTEAVVSVYRTDSSWTKYEIDLTQLSDPSQIEMLRIRPFPNPGFQNIYNGFYIDNFQLEGDTIPVDTFYVCSNESYQIGNQFYNTNGVHFDSLQTVNGCDSLVPYQIIDNRTAASISPFECSAYISPSGNHIWTSTGLYHDTLTNAAGCDSVVTVDLTIQQSTNAIAESACVSYTSPSGNYTWTASGMYTDTLTNAVGCDSIITIDLNILQNFNSIAQSACVAYTSPSGNYIWTTSGIYTDTLTNVNGCDSIVTIDLDILQTSSSIAESACVAYTSPSGNYTWTTSGIYTDTLTNVNGCDSIVTIDLDILQTSSSIAESACVAYTSPSGNYTWTTSGIYTDTLTNVNGCDSIVTIDLDILQTSSSIAESACTNYTSPSGNYTWTTSGIYTDTLTNVNGCDSIVTIDLDILQTSSSIAESACTNYTSPSGNYTWTTSGIYTDTLTNVNGCDSIVTIDLDILQTSSSIAESACTNYTSPSGNHTWTTSGMYLDTVMNTNGCDSILTIDLTILNSTSATDSHVACDAFTWIDGNVYTSSNNSATYTLTNAAGCDSVITLDLTINTVDASATQNGVVLTANAIGASYQWLDCDNNLMVIAGETNQSFTATSNGNYAVVVSENGCSDTSACMSINGVGLTTLTSSQSLKVLVYPNPTTGLVNIDVGEKRDATVVVRDVLLREVNRTAINWQQTVMIEIPGSPGAYFIEVITATGNRSITRVVKN